jgi:hypothetical protein
MHLRQVIVVGLMLVAAGCDNRSGLGFGPGDGGAATGGAGGAGKGGTGGTGAGGAPALCPDLACKNTCPQGFARDEKGCQTCSCMPIACPAIGCLPCPYGYAPSTNPCGTCECNQPPTCPAIACATPGTMDPTGPSGSLIAPCAYGYKKDAAGCNTCTCSPPPTCKPLACPAIACPYGSAQATDAQGCPTCGCSAPACPGLACDLYCPYGNQVDTQGCAICACKPATCTPAECPPPPPLPVRMCSGGGVSQPACQRNANGICGWVVPPCPGDCSQAADQGTCGAISGCAWLQPGCSEPSIPTAGCYNATSVGCAEKMLQCPAGKQCQRRTINPCTSPNVTPPPGTLAGGGAAPQPLPGDKIAIPICTACAQTISLCL